MFALLTAAAALATGNWLIGHLDHRGLVTTHRPDDRVQYIEADVFEEGPGQTWRTTPYAEEWTVPSSFARNKGDGWRMFLYGGSWTMGTPWVHQGQGVERDGSVPSAVRSELLRKEAALESPRPIEVLNLGAGSQNAHRVRRLVEQTVEHEVDVAFVATCNNEGALRPRWVRERLHELGGYRFLASRLLPEVPSAERSYYTPQSAEASVLAEQFRQSLGAIVDATAKAGVPLLLATLPVNLRYESWEVSPIDALAEDADRPPEPPFGPCVARGMELYRARRYDEALTRLESCDDQVEALRWRGLSLLGMGRVEEARAHLEQSVELRPRNRCRPSFNQIVRQEAARSEHVLLVDLELAAQRLAPDGLPGEELFVDSCHMTRDGYAAMATELLDTLEATGLGPRPRGGG